MGKAHATAQAGIAQAQTNDQLREAEARRAAAERERQLLTSYLGTQEQVSGAGVFSSAPPEALKYTQRYNVDQRTLAEIQAAGQGIKNQLNPFQSADNNTRGGLSISDYGQSFATKANDLLAQAEAAARSGDLDTAERLFAQAQAVIGQVSPEAQEAFNLGETPETAAQIRASSTEGRIVGRQLLTSEQLQDPNSSTSVGLRSRLLDPTLSLIDMGANQAASELDQSILQSTLAIDQGLQSSTGAVDEGARQAQIAIDETIRNAERAITAERSQIEGDIRQKGSGGGIGFSATQQLAARSQAASQAARERATVYTNAAAQRAGVLSAAQGAKSGLYADAAREKAGLIADAQAQKAGIFSQAGAMKAAASAQVNLYFNEFAKRMAEDSVRLAQEWVNGTANVRDEYQIAQDRFSMIGIDIANQTALFLKQMAAAKSSGDSGNKLKAGVSGLLGGASAGSAAGPYGAIIGGILGGVGGVLSE